jgi:methylenetetrahydrofolate reductase (NADPH)
MAGKIGVGESARFLRKHLPWFARLATTYSPEKLLARTAAELSTSDSGIAGPHIFTFNQVAEAERWRARLLRG